MHPSYEPPHRHGAPQPFRLGPIAVDPATGEMRGPGGCEQLDPKVMQVLVVLAEGAGSVVSREELFARVWPRMIVTDHVLSRCVYQLRTHLSRAGALSRDKTPLETLPKRGYRLNAEVTAAVHAEPADAATASAQRRGANQAAARRRYGWTAAAGVVLTAGAAVWILDSRDAFWRDPLAGAAFTRLTDFEGVESNAALSPDGKLVAFVSDRDGAMNVWITQVGTGRFRNLTAGGAAELANPFTRNISFSPDGSFVSFWTRVASSSASAPAVGVWAVDTVGGALRPFMPGAAELDWAPRTNRMVYHPASSGDPLFVTESTGDVGHRIFVGRSDLHSHFPVWSPDEDFVYFVHGIAPDEMDLWRIRPDGSDLERLTFHESMVAFPVLLDRRTLLYLATTEDGEGPWLYGMNPERRVPRRISFGVERHTSLAASRDGRRLVATVTVPKAGLWRVPLGDRLIGEADASRIELPTAAGFSPRLGADYMLYVAPHDRGDAIWKLESGAASEIWRGTEGRIAGAPAIAPDGRRIAFAVTMGAQRRLYTMNADGTGVRSLAADLDVRGAPAWAPDGRSIATAADAGEGPRLFSVPLDGAPPRQLAENYSLAPAWSPDGAFVVYSGPESGPAFPLMAISADGSPHPIPALILPRGARRIAFLAGHAGLVVLQGDVRHKNFWLVDLETGEQRQLTDFGPGFVIRDFDVSADGREVVFDRVREESDLVLIDRRG